MAKARRAQLKTTSACVLSPSCIQVEAASSHVSAALVETSSGRPAHAKGGLPQLIAVMHRCSRQEWAVSIIEQDSLGVQEEMGAQGATKLGRGAVANKDTLCSKCATEGPCRWPAVSLYTLHTGCTMLNSHMTLQLLPLLLCLAPGRGVHPSSTTFISPSTLVGCPSQPVLT